MKKRKHIIFGVVFVVLVLVLFGFYYMNALKSVEIKNIRITSVKDMSMEGFTAEGFIEVYNPSLVGLRIYDSEIYFVHKATNQVLGEGKIKGDKLKAKTTTPLGFSQEVKLGNMIGTLLDSLKKGETVIVIKGEIKVSKILDTGVSFETEYDIGKDMSGYVNERLGNWLGFLN